MLLEDLARTLTPLILSHKYELQTLDCNVTARTRESFTGEEERITMGFDVSEDLRISMKTEHLSYSTVFSALVAFDGYTEGTGDYLDSDPYKTPFIGQIVQLGKKLSSPWDYSSKLVVTLELAEQHAPLQALIAQSNKDGNPDLRIRHTELNGKPARELSFDLDYLEQNQSDSEPQGALYLDENLRERIYQALTCVLEEEQVLHQDDWRDKVRSKPHKDVKLEDLPLHGRLLRNSRKSAVDSLLAVQKMFLNS